MGRFALRPFTWEKISAVRTEEITFWAAEFLWTLATKIKFLGLAGSRTTISRTVGSLITMHSPPRINNNVLDGVIYGRSCSSYCQVITFCSHRLLDESESPVYYHKNTLVDKVRLQSIEI